MPLHVHPARLCAPGPARIWSLGLLAAALCACGGGGGHHSVDVPGGPDRDAGQHGGGSTLDGSFPLPVDYDAGTPIPGNPPPELEGQGCAVDTNKIYDLVTLDRQPEPTRLAVDLSGSRFALAYIDKSAQCIDAIYLAELEGASGVGMPSIAPALDPCTSIDHTSIEYNGSDWLLASVDARKDSRDLWVQAFDTDGKPASGANRVTNNLALEREVALLSLGSDAVLAAWVEQDLDGGKTQLKLRPLSAQGKPAGDEVVLDQPTDSTWIVSGLSLAKLGDMFVGLAYRRTDQTTGRSEIVLDVLDHQGMRDRDSWVLSTDAGALGSVDVSADDVGAGAIYSLIQGDSDQLWFQQLGLDGRAAKATSAGRVGGPVDPVRVVGPPYKAIDASLAKLPVGYAIAYRALPGGDVGSPRIRVHFLDRFGRILGKSDVALAEANGGRTAIKSAYDGRITVGWSDTDDQGETTLTAIKLPCVGGI